MRCETFLIKTHIGGVLAGFGLVIVALLLALLDSHRHYEPGRHSNQLGGGDESQRREMEASA